MRDHTMLLRRFQTLRTILPISLELKHPCPAITTASLSYLSEQKRSDDRCILWKKYSSITQPPKETNLLPLSKKHVEINLFLKPGLLYTSNIRNLHHGRTRFSDSTTPEKGGQEEEVKKLSLFQRFKAMYRDYWYVLVPVHVVTSAVWYGSFYYMARTGVDIAALAELVHLSDEIIEKIRRNSNNVAGHLAIAYLLYKVFTPLRYTVTLGGTTVSINYLKKWGWIKPIPKKEELRKMLDSKKLELRRKRDSLKERHDIMKKTVMNKLTSKKRMKKTSDFMRKMLMRKKSAKRSSE